MAKHLVINDGNIVGKVDLSKKPSILPFACFPGFSFVEENLVDIGSLKDLTGDIQSALYVGIYYPSGVCLPVYPIISSKGLVIYQLDSPTDEGFVLAHEKQFQLNSMKSSLGILGFVNWKQSTIYRDKTKDLFNFNFKSRVSNLKSVIQSHGLPTSKWYQSTNDMQLTINVLGSFGLNIKNVFDLLVKPES